MRKAAKKSDPTPRDSIGLSAAYDGDIRGVSVFVGFVKSELISLWLSAPLPEPIKLQLNALQREADGLAHFLAGYEASLKEAKKMIGVARERIK